MKPRLKTEYNASHKRHIWVCRGLGVSGMGLRPACAYADWCFAVTWRNLIAEATA